MSRRTVTGCARTSSRTNSPSLYPDHAIVVNRRYELFDVDISRTSKWGNPFLIGIDGTREEVITKYAAYLAARPDLLADLPSLRGKRLGCWCAPEPCHGDVIAHLVNR